MPTESLQLVLTAVSRDKLLPTVASRLSEINLTTESKLSNETENFENFKNKLLSERLDQIERTKGEDYILGWKNLLEKEIREEGDNLNPLHRYNKLLLKMQKADKANVNRKLIGLILALEAP